MRGRVDPDDNTKAQWQPGEPMVGWVVQVGSIGARTYAAQDYWQTTIVTEIISDTISEDGVRTIRFKTQNSEYVWRDF